MNKALVKIAFRQVIDSTSKGSFEQDVFNDTWNEFLLQAQAYNRENKFTTLQQMIANNPKANSLHYKTGFAIGLYINALNNQVPGIKDTMEAVAMPFSTHRFEVIASDITSKAAHRIAITYISGTMTLLDSMEGHLLLAMGDQTTTAPGEWTDSFLLKLQPGISVCNYCAIASEQVHA